MMKRLAAVAAISLAAMQVLAGFTGVASAAGKKLGQQTHTAVTADSCTVAAGIAVVQSTTDAAIWTDGTYLYCDKGNGGASDFATAPKLADLSSVIVYANDDVVVLLESGNASGTTGRTASYGGLKVTVDAADVLIFQASGMAYPYGGSVVVTDTTFSGQGLVGTIYSASSLEFNGGGGTDNLDASAVSGDVVAYGNDGNDTLKSGSGDDDLYAGAGTDKLYAGAGYDTADCSDDDDANDQCWAGAGDDTAKVGSHALVGYDIVAPGDGYDTVVNTNSDPYAVTYADSTVAVEFDGAELYVYSDTGDDALAAALVSFSGGPKGDLIYDFAKVAGGAGADVIIGTSGNDSLSGGGGKDKIRSMGGDDSVSGDSGSDTLKGGDGDDRVYGGGGDDVLYGLGGVDFLKGGTGIDQTWGGAGLDTCSGEVRDSCEFRKG